MKIKNKFSLSFAPILILALVTYTMIALELFRKDKVAYIFSANQDGSHLASMLSENIYLAQAPLLEVIISSFSFPDGKFMATAKSHLQLTDSIKLIIIYGINNNQLELLDTVGVKSESDKAFIKEISRFEDKSALALFQEQLLIQKEFEVKRFKYEKYLLRLVLQTNAIKTLLDQPRIYHLALAKKEGQILLNSKAETNP
ncbi:MAG: hypothetical protein L6Q37_16555, partial [Bdellovibrionaceae bacterium]|nr:hypothetical protein [Pseudobdellovibrionaceae bacterium]